MQIVDAHVGPLLDEVRRLLSAYAASLGISLDFQDFEAELAGLPGDYAPPHGALLVAIREERVAGCVALRRFADDTCEMKRLYVGPEARGSGLGRALAVAAIERSRAAGYHWMRLDTLPSMERAKAMYGTLGFVEIPAYRYNPVVGATFLQLRLEPDSDPRP